MSSLVFALLLGLLQGLTEFLPVSSSGHLVLAQSLIPGFSQPGALFDVTLHIGTLLAVCLYFWRDLWTMLRTLVFLDRPEAADAHRLLWLLIAGSVPTGAIGLLFRQQFEHMFTDAQGAALWLIVTGMLLFLTDRVSGEGRELSAMRLLDALVIGLAQGLAIIPGLSRSGATIAAGVFLGLERQLLVRYSFLLSIPAVVGAFILQLVAHHQEALQGIDPLAYGVGTLVAAGVGYWSITVLLRLTRSRRLSVFAYYCWTLGGLALLLTAGR
jgi:undecaprenyl-diphosphatase